ncbi:hypothetical protein H2200_000499 [Cladophialophora chaetospira]|uniref:Methyltransferase domain-containing protein n=1 Tax=Cladophialophora chaetospira TaxID=386627 RepID=A0AA39CQE4_9EURO|nr:hypothetical protein H2200_000499 [Cladophialophora chaetospira]
MANPHIDSVRSMYDERSEQYDENQVHVKQAQDYIHWAALRAGESVLDLACGTGLVALLAKESVGQSGHVVGVDISEGMLTVARRKAKSGGLDVGFFNHDITDLSSIRNRILPEDTDGFDVITCASALILLPDPAQAVQHWKSLLRPGGRLITDVQTQDANLVMNVFSAIAPKVGESVPWHSELWQSQESLKDLMVEAGLNVQKIFETDAYAETRYNANEARQLFENAVGKTMFQKFGREDIRTNAEKLFVQQVADTAGPGGSIDEETRYWIVVATK